MFGFRIENIVFFIFFAEKRINNKNEAEGNSKKILSACNKIGVSIFRYRLSI